MVVAWTATLILAATFTECYLMFYYLLQLQVVVEQFFSVNMFLILFSANDLKRKSMVLRFPKELGKWRRVLVL
jgi:hypothetical protein